MFERYTEKARRVIFFARYEASEYGSRYIETEHLLLGLLREDRSLQRRFLGPAASLEKVRAEIEKRVTRGARFAASVEVPLSEESKKVLNLAAEEADKLAHRHIGTEHLLLGLLRVEDSLAARILNDMGMGLAEVREKLAKAGSAERVETRPGSPALLAEIREKVAKIVAGTANVETPSAWFAALSKLEDFLAGLKEYNSEELLRFFAKNARFVDASGKPWNREEIGKHFETLFILYAKKNAAYTIEETIPVAKDVVVAVVLWKNAILASMERAWIHRMSVVPVREAEDVAIALIQVTPVKPS